LTDKKLKYEPENWFLATDRQTRVGRLKADLQTLEGIIQLQIYVLCNEWKPPGVPDENLSIFTSYNYCQIR
jgi:hypothetical protein